MKLPQFLAKLSSKQIYGIFAFATALFVIIGFVVAQNIQNYGKNSSSQTNSSSNSSSNSATNSSNDSKKSSQNSNSNSNNSSNSNANSVLNNSQNQNSTANSASKENPQSNSVAKNQTQAGIQKFVGKIGNSEIEMNLNFGTSKNQNGTISYDNITGSYSYKSQNKPINLKGNYSISGSGNYGGWYFEEFVESQKTGTFETVEGSGFNSTIPEKTSKIEGTWSNPDKTIKLPFSLEKVEEFKLDDFLRKGDSKLQPLVADAEHDVVVLEECDLAVRFKKSEISVSFVNNIYNFNNLVEPNNPMREGLAGSIECSNKPFEITKSGPLNYDLNAQKVFLEGLNIPEAQNLIQNIYAQGNAEYSFQFNKKYYRFFYVLRAPSDYNFQFNSLAPSTASVKL